MTSEKSVFCPKYVEYGVIRMEYMNTYSKRGPKMDVFRIKFSSLREFSTQGGSVPTYSNSSETCSGWSLEGVGS